MGDEAAKPVSAVKDELLDSAFAHHQAGRNASAARGYEALLREQPDHPDGLHLYGLLHHQAGYHQRAAELIGRAVALRPDAAAYHSNLAESLRALGQIEEAIEHCRSALRLQPSYPEAANNLGVALNDLGRFAEAVEHFRAALAARPDFAMAHNNLGTALRELDQPAEALEAFRMAVELDPQLAMARANLGQALALDGQLWEALENCRQAVREQPGLAAAHNNLGNVYRGLERHEEAQAAYQEALRLNPKLGLAQSNLGRIAQAEGRLQEALGYFHKAVKLSPNDLECWENLARAHAADENFAAAVPCCERMVLLQPDKPRNYSVLGWALQQDGRLREAAACFERGRALDPDNLDLLVNQGAMHEELGEMAEAEACFRRAHELYPAAPMPLSHLAQLLRGKLPEQDRIDLRCRLYETRLDFATRTAMLFAQAHVCDGVGEYAEAAGCLEIANRMAEQIRRRGNQSYNAVEHREFVDSLVENFTPKLFGRLAGTGDGSRQLVFVFGLPRSGTTLVEQVLASHSRVHAAGELRVARDTFESIPKVLGRPLSESLSACLPALTPSEVQKLVERHWTGLRASMQKGSVHANPERIADKMPDNYLYLGLLALLFPQATYVYVRRDLRDIAVSCWMTSFRSIRWADDRDNLAERFGQHQRLMDHWAQVLPIPIYELHYERLVEDFESEARRLLAACGLEWEPACAAFHETRRPIRTASVTQVRQPLYKKSLARWRHYEKYLADLFERIQAQADGNSRNAE